MSYWDGYRWVEENPEATGNNTSSAGSIAGHIASRVSEALVMVGIIGALAFGVGTFTGHPAGAGEVHAQSGSGSSISLAGVNGSSATVQPWLGSTVTFATTYPTNIKNPRIEVLCYQSGSLVYGEAGAVTDGFQLGGGGSVWLTNGGAASCTANLFYFGSHAGVQTYNLLATTGFSAGG